MTVTTSAFFEGRDHGYLFMLGQASMVISGLHWRSLLLRSTGILDHSGYSLNFRLN